jgi:hypothetical protein
VGCHVRGQILGGGEQIGEAVDQFRAVDEQAVVEAARPDAADEAVEVVHRPLGIGRCGDGARQVRRQLLELTARRGLGEQSRNRALEEVEEPASIVFGEQRREDRAHRAPMLRQRAVECGDGVAAEEPHGACQALAAGRVGR